MSHHFINQAFVDPEMRNETRPIELGTFGEPVLDSEELTELTYRVFLTMMARRYSSGPMGCIEPFNLDLGCLLAHGLYVPCVERVTYTHHVDQHLDGLPDHAAVFILKSNKECSIQQVRRIERFPRGVASLAPGSRYKHVTWIRGNPSCRHEKRYSGSSVGDTDVLNAYDSYATVTPDDRVVHAAILHRYRRFDSNYNSAATVWPTLVFNAWADRRYLWQVRTQDHVIQHLETPLTLGVGEEHVKSLFYARNLPVTETGRKRPILHWVRAHARRIAEGTDIDVARHLRGITAFEMDGLQFAIVSPDKETLREETR